MAKKPKSVAAIASDGIDATLLKRIADATAADSFVYVTKAEADPLLMKSFIVVNLEMIDPNDNMKAASRITSQGLEYLKNMTTPNAASAPVQQAPSAFAIITNAQLPPSRRGNKSGGAPKKYPFDQLQIGQSFFVGKSTDNSDPVKTLGSTVSAANMRYAKETGDTKQVERTKRGPGNKAVVNPDGSKAKETVTVPVYKFERKFSLRAVKSGEKYGEWVAPADGALIARVSLD